MSHTHRTSRNPVPLLTGLTMLALAPAVPAQQDQARRIEVSCKAIDPESCYVKRPTWQDTLRASLEKMRNDHPTFALGQCSLNDRWFRNGPHAVPPGKRAAETDFKVALTGLDLGAKTPGGARVWEYEGPVPAGQPCDLKLPARSSVFHCRQFEADAAGPLAVYLGSDVPLTMWHNGVKIHEVKSGATVSPVSGSSNNFTGPVQYTVTAEDGITRASDPSAPIIFPSPMIDDHRPPPPDMHHPSNHRHYLMSAITAMAAPALFCSSITFAADDEAARIAAEQAAHAAARVVAAAKAKAALTKPEGWEMGPFVKHPEPVLKPDPESVFDCPIMGKGIRWEEMNTYNPAAVVKDGKIYLLYRADGHNPACAWGRICRIGLATSDDGIHFTRRPEPVLYPANDDFKQYEWAGGCEDLHVIEGEDGLYYMNYTTHTGQHLGIKDTMSIATSRDLVHWTKHGPAFQKHDPDKVNGSRSGVVVSRRVGDKLIAAKIDGKYWMFYTHGCAMAWSEDLINWHWAGKAGWPRGAEAGAIALLRDDGILLMAQTGAGPLGGWCLWQQLHDRADLTTKQLSNNGILKEQKDPFLWPEHEWEIKGMTGYTTVSNALVPFKGKWFLYYGAADTCTGVATCPIRERNPAE